MSPPIKILLVDDIEQNLVVLQALLERPGLELLCAHSGAQALELLLTHPVALALLDVQMPVMDGFELAELMRGSPRTRQVPIIFLTATDRNAVRTFRGYEAGAVDFLYKPFDPHILRSKVEVFVKLYAGQRQLAEQMAALEHSLRTNEMFVAILGHDLRNPLSAMMSLAEMVARGGESERTRTLGQRICASGTRMARLVDQMLDLAAMRAGKVELRPVSADLQGVCDTVIEEFAASHAAGRIVREARGDTRGWWDVDRLAQVFSNLVGNALQHGAEAPVRIDLDGTADESVRVYISNTGTIPSEMAARLFTPFERGAQESGRQGLGLGLYIAHELVKLHDGAISVHSDGGETVFEVTLPKRGRYAGGEHGAGFGQGL